MKAKSVNLTKGSADQLLPQIAEKLRGKVLFPQKVEAARQYLNKIKTSS
jgi:hypothetical protein